MGRGAGFKSDTTRHTWGERSRVGHGTWRMVLSLTLYEVAYRALRRSTAVASAAWSRMDCRIQRTNLTLRWVARRACRTRVDRSWPAAAHFWAAASVRLIRR